MPHYAPTLVFLVAPTFKSWNIIMFNVALIKSRLGGSQARQISAKAYVFYFLYPDLKVGATDIAIWKWGFIYQ